MQPTRSESWEAVNQSEARIASLRRVTTGTVESGTSKSGGRGHSKILYQKVNQHDQEQDLDSDQENCAKDWVVREPPSSSIMELNIHNRRLFLGSFLAVEVTGLLAVIMTIAWVIEFKGGVVWGTTELGINFNWHPILMTLGLIFLYGNGALIYRVFPPRNDSHKLGLKIGHAVVMMITFIIMVIGLQAAFDSHNLATPPKPNLYTLHSWIGLIAALLFGLQWALGFSAFLFPKFSPEIRSILMPFHQYFGSSILCLAVAAALMGHLEKAIWSNKAYSQKDSESMVVNFIGVFLVLFVMGVTFLLSKFSKENPAGHRAV